MVPLLPSSPRFGLAFAMAESTTTPVLHPEEQRLLSPTAPPQRRLQFALGRHAARTAIHLLGGRPEPILRDANGAPRWPSGIVGSISHSGGCACALVGRSELFCSVGIDLEWIRSDYREGFARRFFTVEEAEWSEREPESEQERISLLFSGRESLYKALAPLGPPTPSFRDVVLRKDAGDSFTAFLLDPAKSAHPELFPCTLEVVVRDQIVLTWVALHHEAGET